MPTTKVGWIVQGAGSVGTVDDGIVTVQGIVGGQALPISGNISGTAGDAADGVATSASGDVPTAPRLYGFNGATWDRLRALDDNSDGVAGGALGRLVTASRLYGRNAGATWDRLIALGDNADAVAGGGAGRLITMSHLGVWNGASWDRAKGDATNGAIISQKQTTVVVASSPAANTGATLTLAAPGAGLFHYITHIYIDRHATAALAGGATLTVTTTNLNGITWRTGNQASITVSTADGMTLTDSDYATPIKSAVANTASTIVLPAPGAAVLWTAWVAYYTGP